MQLDYRSLLRDFLNQEGYSSIHEFNARVFKEGTVYPNAICTECRSSLGMDPDAYDEVCPACGQPAGIPIERLIGILGGI